MSSTTSPAMRTLRYRSFGNLDVLELADVTVPEPEEG